MQFLGFWVDGNKAQVKITKTIFDETDLSEDSDWKEAFQNEDPSGPHGYVNWKSALADVERRLGIKFE